MNGKDGTAFLLILAAAAAVWYGLRMSRSKTVAVANTAGAGLSVVPQPGVSNSDLETNNAWETPYYLRANYPATRAGNEVVPSIVTAAMPYTFGPQQIPPQM